MNATVGYSGDDDGAPSGNPVDPCPAAIGDPSPADQSAIPARASIPYRALMNRLILPEYFMREHLAETRSILAMYSESGNAFTTEELDRIAIDELLLIHRKAQANLVQIEKVINFLGQVINKVRASSPLSTSVMMFVPTMTVGVDALELDWDAPIYGGKIPNALEIIFPEKRTGNDGRSRWLEIQEAQFSHYLDMKNVLSHFANRLNLYERSLFASSPAQIARELLGEFNALPAAARISLEFNDAQVQPPRNGEESNYEKDLQIQLERITQGLEGLQMFSGRRAIVDRTSQIMLGIAKWYQEVHQEKRTFANIVSNRLRPELGEREVASAAAATSVLLYARYRLRLATNTESLLSFLYLKLSTLKEEGNEDAILVQKAGIMAFASHLHRLVFGMNALAVKTALRSSPAFPPNRPLTVPPMISDAKITFEYLRVAEKSDHSPLHENLDSFLRDAHNWRSFMEELTGPAAEYDFNLVAPLEEQMRAAEIPTYFSNRVGLLIRVFHDDGSKIEMIRPGEWIETLAHQHLLFAGFQAVQLSREEGLRGIPVFEELVDGHLVRRTFLELRMPEYVEAPTALYRLRRYDPSDAELTASLRDLQEETQVTVDPNDVN